MNGPFESVTKVAIEEILRAHAKDSKFGLVLPPSAIRDVVDDIFGLIQTSRCLKAAGDKMLAMGMPPRKPDKTKPARTMGARGSVW